MDQSNDGVMVKVQCSPILAEHFLHRFVNFFNHIFETQFDGAAYFESIADGFVFFAKSDIAFASLWGKFNEDLIEKCSINPSIPNYLLNPHITEDFFPLEGFYFDFHFLNRSDITEFVEMIQDFFAAIDSNVMVSNDESHIIIKFNTWDCFKKYLDLLLLRLEKE
jgi:hypothetical protein